MKHSSRHAQVIGCSLIVLATALGAVETAHAAPLSCTVESIKSVVPADTTIVAATSTAAPVSHCRIDGYITTTNPGPGKVNFRLQLPDKNLWKGRYYFTGMGGAAGYVPTDSQIPRGNPMVKGFAVAGTDTGHEGAIGDWSFMSDPVKALDHVHRAAHLTAVVTQQVTKAYYLADKIYRYHSGCSGGGRMGSEAIRRYPEDYDGVLVGSGIGTGGSKDIGPLPAAVMLKFIQAAQEQTREPGAWISPAKLKMVDAQVTAACDNTDGAHDGVVWDSRLCHYDVAQLQCKSGDQAECLTQPEIKTLKAILRGPRGPKGELLTASMPISNMSTWTGFNAGSGPPPWSTEPSPENMKKAPSGYIMATTMAHGFIRPDYDVLKEMDFSLHALQEWNKGLRDADYSLPNVPQDLVGFEKAGGKVIWWNGASDPCCSYIETEQLYDDTVKLMKDRNRVAKFAALYGIPGQGHCGGGTGPGDAPDTLLQTLIDWVEQGKMPSGVVTHRGADRMKPIFADINAPSESGVTIPLPVGESREFLVCPYPQVSVFNKSKANVPGAVYEAANWSCRASRQ